MKQEIAGLMVEDGFQILSRNSVPTGENILGGRTVMEIYNFDTTDEKMKVI